MTVRAPFWHKVAVRGINDCWPWLAGLTAAGYGMDGSGVYAHRLAYQLTFGEIPEGLVIDHKCHNGTACEGGRRCRHRRCVNPLHLDAVTHAENQRRSHLSKPNQTHCKRGHEFIPETTKLDVHGHRSCRICIRESDRRTRKIRNLNRGS